MMISLVWRQQQSAVRTGSFHRAARDEELNDAEILAPKKRLR
jgi:hypothetical protein